MFSGTTALDEEAEADEAVDENIDMKTVHTSHLDFLCVRYNNISPDVNANEADSPDRVTWVGHCVTVRVQAISKTGMLRVQLALIHSSNDLLLPRILEHTGLANVEWIPRALPNRRMEQAVCSLLGASDLAKSIALGTSPAPLDAGYKEDAEEHWRESRSSGRLHGLNMEQTGAVCRALTSPFSLIQGPPGTGKSVVAAHLVELFAGLNRRSSGHVVRAQVLYCGPSNKSVDVVAGYLKDLGPRCPSIVRVYSDVIVQQEFPMPGELVRPQQKRYEETDINFQLRDISLHHLIRQDSQPYARVIKEYDAKFKNMKPENVKYFTKEIDDYKQKIHNAEKNVLLNMDVILLTCNASASGKLKKVCDNVGQIVIDECGMCTEPESLIPIVNCRNIKQVVLIGDHKQLHPIVVEDLAVNLGLNRSLFERYSDKAHEAIANFPSAQFYGGKLETGSPEQNRDSTLAFWPNGRNKPLAFVHVAGKEEILKVTTSEGNEQSKSNMEEAQEAVRIVHTLTSRYHVRQCDVVVLSQYRAQVALLRRLLDDRGVKGTPVSTVVASQGSQWQFVVLSCVRSRAQWELERRPTRGWVRRNMGFVSDANQINVAITRARRGLVIIGNKHLLACDVMWRRLLQHYEGNNKVVDANEFMKVKT